MPAWWPNNTSPAWKFYQEYEWPKAPYPRYYQRVTKWKTFEEAIQDKNIRLASDVLDTGRVCPKCQTFKEWGDYNRSRTGTSGYTTRCRDCINAYKASYRASWAGKMRNRNYKIIQKNTKWEEYRKKNTESHRLYVEAHKEELREKKRQWYEENRELINKKRREYHKRIWGVWRRVEYKWSEYTILAKDKVKWILISQNGMRIFVRKMHCKPITKKTLTKREKLLKSL